MKQKAFAKINSKKKALYKHTALDKAANNIKQALYTTLYATALK